MVIYTMKKLKTSSLVFHINTYIVTRDEKSSIFVVTKKSAENFTNIKRLSHYYDNCGRMLYINKKELFVLPQKLYEVINDDTRTVDIEKIIPTVKEIISSHIELFI